MFPLHTVLLSTRAWYDATIQGQPVLDAEIRPIGIDYNAFVCSEDHGFRRFCRNQYEAQRFIHSKLDGYEIQLSELQQHAVDLVAKFGPFVVKKERDAITLYTSVEYWHDDYKGKKLQAVVDKLERRVSDKLVEAKAELSTPDSEVKEAQLSDAEVAAGIRYLTGQDADRASLANDRGWSPTVSGKGHWACAMLDTDPAAAIHVARQFIGGYTRQLREGGIL